MDRTQILSRIVTGKVEHSSLRGSLIRSSVGTFGLMVAGTCLSLIFTAFLARILGTTGYGAYAYAKTWVSVLSVPAVLGFEGLIVRNMAVYQTNSAWGLMSGLLRRANQMVLLASVGIVFLAAVFSISLAARFDPQMLSVFWVSLPLLPLVAFTSIRYAALRGLNYVLVGQVPGMLIQPILFIGLILGMYLLVGRDLTAPWAMGMNVAVNAVIFLIATILLHKFLPQAVKNASPEYQTSAWMRSALPLLFFNGMYIIISGADTIMLGALKGVEPVGTYALAKRGAGLITFILMAVNTALAPTIAGLYARKDMKQLQHVVTKSIRLTLFVTVPVAVGLLAFGDWFLRIFGRDFTQGQAALAILSTGQLINVAIGSVGQLLIMTGHEKDAAVGVGISMVLNIILNAILIPQWGLEGAAAATTISTILLNALLAIWVYKRLRIHSTALGSVYLRRET